MQGSEVGKGEKNEMSAMCVGLKKTINKKLQYIQYCVLCICHTVSFDVFPLDAGLLDRGQYSEGPPRHRFFLVSLCL
jgi:hypothetical protein